MNLLFSYAYIARMRRAWEFIRRASGGIDFLLDSGAHSAWNLGTHIDLGSYVDCCQRNAEYLWDYVVLDVVADKRSTLRNLATMRRAGLRPMTVLTSDMSMRLMPRLSADGCRVAIAGGVTETMKWYGPRIKAAQAAAPGTQLHGLGFSRGLPVATTPVHSVDSSTYKEH